MKVKVVSLLLLGLWTLDGFVVILGSSNLVVDACPKLCGVKAPDSASKDCDSGKGTKTLCCGSSENRVRPFWR